MHHPASSWDLLLVLLVEEDDVATREPIRGKEFACAALEIRFESISPVSGFNIVHFLEVHFN